MDAEFDVSTEQYSTVPGRLYDYDMSLLLDKEHVLHISEAEVRRQDSRIGKTRLHIIPQLRIGMIAVQAAYKLNQRDTYATMAVYGLSAFEHAYNRELMRVKDNRTADFFSGNKMEDLVKRFGYCEHFFEKQSSGQGSRKEVNLFGDSQKVLAAIGEYAEFFNMSTSDMAQVILCHAIVRWDKLPGDFKTFFEDIIKRFDAHAKNFYNIYYVESHNQSHNPTITQSHNHTMEESKVGDERDGLC